MKKQVLMSIGLMMLLFALAACGSESADVVEVMEETAVEPTAEPVEEPTDEPVEEVVEEPTAEPVEESEEAPSATILIAESDALGAYLTDDAGMTLYTFLPDSADESVCYDQCALLWPPFLAEDGVMSALDAAINGELSSIERTDGGMQVTYNGKPLYYWVKDTEAGDTTGQGVKNVWGVAHPGTTVALGNNADLGKLLVDADGMTLYRFNNDEAGKSNCYDGCAANWPPLLVDEGVIPTGAAGVVGKLGTAVRDDGTIQVTYEGMPLYGWVNDAAAGDATGQGVNDVWFIASQLTVGANGNEELGDFLVGANGMTLYEFAADKNGESACYDQCATLWPPLLVQNGEMPVSGFKVGGDLGVSERTDGTMQVTHNGKPLYYWINDTEAGDTTGQGVKNVWGVAHPGTTVALGNNADLGKLLVDADGMTLYRFNNDEAGKSNCYDGCAANWPPLLVDEGVIPTGAAGVVGELGTAVRDDGTIQVTYEGMPLYGWVNDAAAGDATGQGVNDVWFIASQLTVGANGNEELGDFLVGANGMTLYQFATDADGESACYDQCAVNWPPLLVQNGEVPVSGFKVGGDLGVSERADGTMQVTYNGNPIYFWVNDSVAGDTTGQGVNDAWFIIAP